MIRGSAAVVVRAWGLQEACLGTGGESWPVAGTRQASQPPTADSSLPPGVVRIPFFMMSTKLAME